MILPCLLFRKNNEASSDFKLKIQGGTHVNFSPTVFPIQHCLIPALKLFGAEVDFKVIQNGYFPDVVGSVEATVKPMNSL